ncbi:MAG: ATP-binding cassette domain-containing protein, partial [Bacteroidales bacterium]|nr:ATP-binding cassette domain-containing protein [Bacteroidales bacterium]
MNTLLRTNHLSIGYHTPLFNDLNLSLHSQQLTCLMGRNGVGKSTILKTLSGLLMPLS